MALRHDVSQFLVWTDCPFKDQIDDLDEATVEAKLCGILKYGDPDYWSIPVVVKRDDKRFFLCLEEPVGGWKNYAVSPGHLYVAEPLDPLPSIGLIRARIRILRLQTLGQAHMRGEHIAAALAARKAARDPLEKKWEALYAQAKVSVR